MSLRHSAGRIWITDPTDAVTVFDTNERPFIATDYKSGQVSLPSYTASYYDPGTGQDPTQVTVYQDATTDLGAINAGANAVIGMFAITSAGGIGFANQGWFSAGGTILHGAQPAAIKSGPVGGGGFVWSVLGGLTAITFFADAGQLKVRIVTVLNVGTRQSLTGAAVGISMVQNAMTIDYAIYCGTYL